MSEPFGKRNRRVIIKPQPAGKRPSRGRSPKTSSPATFYAYAIGWLLFIVFTGFALA
jgi:hypothetical protein